MTSKLLGRIRSDIISDIHEVRPLTSTEYENYKRATKTLNNINQNLTLFKVVYYNFKDYELSLNHSLKQFVENPVMNDIRMEGMVLELNRRISNYLSSVRLFLDHSEYTLKSKYDKDSSILKEFKQTCSNAYDNNFSYRFLYKLRNYVQHCGMPIGSINVGSGLVDNDPKKIRYHLELQFDRNSLLEGFDWKKLESEIKALPPKFDINPHIDSMNKSIGDITFALIKNELPNSIRCSEYLKRLIIEAMKGGDSQCTPCILDAKKLTRTGGNVSMQWFPLHIIQWIDRFNENKSVRLKVVYDPPSNLTKPSYNPPSNLTKLTVIKNIDKNDRKNNLNKGVNGMLYYIPEDHQICQKCGGPLGFYYKNEVGMTGKRYTAESFGCLKCKGIVS